MKYRMKIAAVAAALTLSSLAAYAKDPQKICRNAVFAAIDGDAPDYNGAPDPSPETMFTNHGSQNIALVCNVAKYIQTGKKAWFMGTKDQVGYFDYQTQHGFLGTELNSPGYNTSVDAAVFALGQYARQYGDHDLVAKVEEWQRAKKALDAAGTVRFPIKRERVIAHGQEETCNGADWNGPSVALPSSRTLPCQTTYSSVHAIDALALDIQPRNYGGPIKRDNSAWDLRLLLETAGYKFHGNSADLNHFSIPADLFGLTEQERAELREFTESGAYVETLERLVGKLSPVTPITIMRNGAGEIISYFGTAVDPNMDGFNPNGNKGTAFGKRMTMDGELLINYPHDPNKKLGQPRGASGRVGNQQCAEASGVHTCIDLIADPTLTLQWDAQGLRRIGESTTPPPQDPAPTDPQTPSDPTLPSVPTRPGTSPGTRGG